MARIRINGTSTNDTLVGNDLINDTFELFGFGGTDTLLSGAGADYLNGGFGFDFASYQAANSGVTVDMLGMNRNTGWAKGDVFESIEGLIGSRLDDKLSGDNGNNIFDGFGGNDTIHGRGGDDIVRDVGGNDTFDGGDDNFDPDNPANPNVTTGDILEYTGNDDLKLGITANLATGIVVEHSYVVNGVAARDRISGFEGIRGTAYGDTIYGAETSDAVLDGRDGNDVIYGRGGNDVILGGVGNDVLDGGAGYDYLAGGNDDDRLSGGADADAIHGGGGIDTVSYEYVTSADAQGRGVRVNLAYLTPADVYIQKASASDGPMGSLDWSTDQDEPSGIENVIGTAFDDTISGDSQENVFFGGNGDDYLIGYGGRDTLYGGSGDDILYGDLDADTLYGGDGNDLLRGGSGGDYIDGGAGTDTLTFGGELNAVTIFLGNPSLNTGSAAGDTYVSIERIIGSEGGDVIHGNNSANHFYGAGGADALYGGGGMDTLIGGSGGDILNGGTDIDTVDYSAEYGQQGVYIDLMNQANNKWLAAGDTLTSIEILIGTNYSDVFFGDNRDFMVFHGGGGTDMAMFTGNRSQYTIEVLYYSSGSPYARVTHNAANGDGVDTLSNIEWLNFADQTLSFSDLL
jgi:Ca2+-binding RTX toxin-like protein